MLVPTDKTELIQLLRDLADALERNEAEYKGCRVTHAMERALLSDGRYADVADMAFDLRVDAASKRAYQLFKEFDQVQHYAPRTLE